MKRVAVSLVIALFAGPTSEVHADWLQFRGPGGSGVASDKGVPVEWNTDKNIAWKTEMPGFGGSSPIVVGDRVFVACYSGYGLDRDNAGDQKDLRRHLVCVDRKTGKTLWTRTLDAALPEAKYSGPFITLHGYASNTSVSDGKSVYVFFGKSGVFAFDLDGKQLWQGDVGKGTNGWGSGTSLVLHKDLVIANASVESGSLIAFDKNSGKQVWTAKGIRSSWNTPIIVRLPDGSAELVVATQPKMLGFDPDTGKELWSAETYNWYVCPSVVAHDGVVYGLQHSICVAVKAGGRGDVTKTHVLWKKNFGAVVTSPLFYNGHVYWASSGTANCVKASDGSVVYKERLKGAGGEFYAAPTAVDGKLYYVNRNDSVFVVEAGPTFKLLARNTLGDKGIFNAPPAVSNSQMLLRSDRYLYCIGK